jgi:hypothetical protein
MGKEAPEEKRRSPRKRNHVDGIRGEEKIREDPTITRTMCTLRVMKTG